MQLRRTAGRVAAALGIAAASVAGTAVTTAAPASAACVNYGQFTQYTTPYHFSVAWDYKPASSCNDINVDYISNTAYVSGWYYAGSWTPGASGWHLLYFGWQNPWAVLVTGVYPGTPISVATYLQNWFWVSWQI